MNDIIANANDIIALSARVEASERRISDNVEDISALDNLAIENELDVAALDKFAFSNSTMDIKNDNSVAADKNISMTSLDNNT